jgi:hypothetical protein
LVIKEIQIKTTLRYHLILVKMAIINDNNNNINKQQQMLVRMWQKGIFLHCWWECKLVQLLWKVIWRSFKKLKIELPCHLVTWL